jgi:hypothetical protein
MFDIKFPLYRVEFLAKIAILQSPAPDFLNDEIVLGFTPLALPKERAIRSPG